ncbi:A24 family peptidase [Cupriavidus sp. 30B13]|uniref:A24 family peptidase n=1 Tax=Cupriavidus sp. 30B13 TaxID=3384241 RepID=UPI003B901C56
MPPRFPHLLQDAIALVPPSLTFAALVLPPALLWAVLSDLLYRRIANRLVLALLALWTIHAAWLAFQDGQALAWPELGRSALAAALVLVVGYGLFAMRWVGAGDVKLVAVLCLWLGGDVSMFLLVTSLAGGVLALGMPVLRRVELCVARRVEQLGPWLRRPLATPMALRSHSLPGIPYGFAIAAGAAFVLFLG